MGAVHVTHALESAIGSRAILMGPRHQQWPFWRDAYRTALWDELTLGIPAPELSDLNLDHWTVKYDADRKRDVLERPRFRFWHGKVSGVTA